MNSQKVTCGEFHKREVQARLAEAFPGPDQIPPECRLSTTNNERLYLLDGQLRAWEGPLAEVSSPICLRQDGTLKRPVIGHVPSMDEITALAGFEAAVRAWDHGQGRWPTLSVSARIEAVEHFVTRMLAVRDEVVKRQIVAGRHSSFLHTDFIL